jgi:deoxyribodipyrimidine photolyase-related protein
MSESTATKLGRYRRIRSAGTLLVVLGDQLDRQATTLRRLDRSGDAVLMAEVAQEAEHVASHPQRTALFLSAMRHFALELIDRGYRVRYVRLDESSNTQALATELERAVAALGPQNVLVTRPGEHRVERSLRDACRRARVDFEVLEDQSFTCTLDEFDEWADARSNLVMEHFYRARRRALHILLEANKPAGGRWNFDADNRLSFKKAPSVPQPYRPRSDVVTAEVKALVEKRFPNAYGRTAHFRWPVSPDQARRALADFVANRLRHFGTYQDAMWTGEPVLYHSLLSPSLNLKLISPGECVEAAVAAYEGGAASLNNVEAFVRQLIGWREFVRGVYYREGSDYPRRNGLGHDGSLPPFFWTGETDMNCLRHCIGEVLDNAHGHHIARLMVIGNFALIAGVDPRAVNDWFLGMYADGVEWATAPNVIGMSQYADGGVVATKPYAASGKYIDRMSNYCRDCRYSVSERSGDDACPFNTLYWDFLLRHRRRFEKNQRMALVVGHLRRLPPDESRAVRRRADRLRNDFSV